MATDPGKQHRDGRGSDAEYRRFGLLGRFFAILSFLIAIIPSAFVFYWLVEAYLQLRASPTTSWRPMLHVVGLGLSLLTLIVWVPFPILAERFGRKSDGDLALLSVCFIALPAIFGFFGPLVVCWATGSSFGS